MPGSHIQNPGSSIQEEVTDRGGQQISALKKTESQTWVGNAVKKTESPLFLDSVFFQLLKKQSPQKVGTLIFFTAFPPLCLGLCFFSELKFFGLLSPSLHLYAGARVLDMASWRKSAIFSSISLFDMKLVGLPGSTGGSEEQQGQDIRLFRISNLGKRNYCSIVGAPLRPILNWNPQGKLAKDTTSDHSLLFKKKKPYWRKATGGYPLRDTC